MLAGRLRRKKRGKMSKVLITGATSGIGLAYAKYYASNNYDLILTGTKETLLIIAKEIENEFSVKVKIIIKTINNEKDVDEIIKLISNEEIEILVNNAGYGIKGLFFNNDIEDYIRMINLHLILTLKLTSHCINKMLIKNIGLVINVSSDGAILPIPGNSVYSGTKAFLLKYTECLYLDLLAKKSNVKTIVVCPGFTKTEFHGKMGIEKDRVKNKSVVKWSTPQDVVERSVKDINKNKIVSFAGGNNSKMQMLLYKILPKRIFYNIVVKKFG